jgi:hypothetical protein
MGIEIHYMFYQFDMDDAIGNTTFCNMRVINRGNINYADFRASLYSDMDIGGFSDDYVGTDAQRNMVYTYNSDPFDQGNGGSVGYEDLPPAAGIVSLNNNVLLTNSYTSTSNYPYNDPSGYQEYWNVMNGMYLDGSSAPLFTYPGDLSTGTGGDTEVQLSTSPGDRRVVLSIKAGQFNSGDEKSIDFAVIFNQGTDNVESAIGLGSVADSVQTFYDTEIEDCFIDTTSYAGLSSLDINDITLYPNPSKGVFFLRGDESILGANYSILDISGRVLVESTRIESLTQKVIVENARGTYLLVVNKDGVKRTKRILIE